MRVLLETDNAIVGFDELKKSIVVIWSGNPQNNEFTLVYNNVLKAFKIYFVNKLVNDFAKFNNLTPYQTNLLSEKIFPIAYKCGMRELINVGSNSGIVEGFSENVESIFASKNKKISIQTFDNFNKAFEFILA